MNSSRVQAHQDRPERLGAGSTDVAAALSHALPVLTARATALVGRPEQGTGMSAEDLVQETCARVLANSRRAPPNHALLPWANKIMSNLLIDHWRLVGHRRWVPLDPGRLEQVPQPDREPPPWWSGLTVEQVRAAAHECLSPSIGQVWEMVVVDGLSYEEASRRLDLPRGTVGSRMLRARRKLRRLLEERTATGDVDSPSRPAGGPHRTDIGDAVRPPRSDTDRVVSQLAATTLFQAVGADVLRELVAMVRLQRYRPGEQVVRQGDAGHGLFIVLSGFLREIGTGGGTVRLRCPGELFGEGCLLDGGAHATGATALSRAEMVVIERDSFLRLLQARPQLGQAIMTTLADRLRAQNARSENLAALPVGTRLAREILRLGVNLHGTGGHRVRLSVKLSQRELGELVGATRESVNKQLRRWRDEGLVDAENGHLVITDLDRLRALLSPAPPGAGAIPVAEQRRPSGRSTADRCVR